MMSALVCGVITQSRAAAKGCLLAEFCGFFNMLMQACAGLCRGRGRPMSSSAAPCADLRICAGGLYGYTPRPGLPHTTNAVAAIPVDLDTTASTRFDDLLYEPIVDETGTVTGIFTGGYDVAEQIRRRPRSLSEGRSALMTRNGRDGTWDLDLRTGVLARSAYTSPCSGCRPTHPRTSRRSSRACTPGRPRPRSRGRFAHDRSAIRAPTTCSTAPSMRATAARAGSRSRGQGLFDEDRTCTRAVGTVIDISARKFGKRVTPSCCGLNDVLHETDTDKALSGERDDGRFFGVYLRAWTTASSIRSRTSSIRRSAGPMASYPPLLDNFPATPSVKIVERLRAGQTVVVGDLQTDPLERRTGDPRSREHLGDPRRAVHAATAACTIVYVTTGIPAVAPRRDRLHAGGRRGGRRRVSERGGRRNDPARAQYLAEARVEARTAELRTTETPCDEPRRWRRSAS